MSELSRSIPCSESLRSERQFYRVGNLVDPHTKIPQKLNNTALTFSSLLHECVPTFPLSKREIIFGI